MLNKRKNLPQHKTIKKGECDMYRKNAIFKNLYLSIFCFVFSLFFSFSTPAFFSPNTQANCALPLYLSALQGGQGQVSKTAQLTAKKKHIIEPDLKRIQEEIDAADDAINTALEVISKRINKNYDEDEETYIADQIKDYIENNRNKKEAYATHCGDHDSYNSGPTSPSSFFAYFEAFKPPSDDEIPVFNLALLQTITKKSFHALVPAAAAVTGTTADSGGGCGLFAQDTTAGVEACECMHDKRIKFNLDKKQSCPAPPPKKTCC